MIDCIVEGHGDLGLMTDETHQRRELGTATAAATLRLGFSLGLESVHWDCSTNNPGSVRTAQKPGLRNVGPDQMFVFAFDADTHASILDG